MLTDRFGLLDLADLALKLPEVGHVNFNILHTIITTLITKLDLQDEKVPCFIVDEVLAQTAVTNARLHGRDVRRPSNVLSVKEMKEKMKKLDEGGEIEEETSLAQVAERMGGTEEGIAEAILESISLKDADLLEQDGAKVVQELWRSIHINRRMEGAETGMKALSEIIDELLGKIEDVEEQCQEVLEKSRYMLKEIERFVGRVESLEKTCSLLAPRIDECDEKRASEVERLEEIIKELQLKQENADSTINVMRKELEENVAYKFQIDELKEQISEDLEINTREIKKLIREVEDTLVKKEDFQELIFRVEQLEEEKVSRHELGRLLEPGFIDSFLEEQKNLRIELEELKETVIQLDYRLEELKKMIEEEVIKIMNEKFSEVHSILDTINAKLALLDPDEINDSFANLEEQVEQILSDLAVLTSSFEEFLKEAKTNFSKMINLSEWLNRLEQTKMDKSKLYELLETKADIDLIVGKIDRKEFSIVVGDMKNDIERLTLTVKINEEEMNEGFTKVSQELALTMYKEDFIYGTEPIRNRIKALIYELKRVKEITLTHLFPDAPGIAKCLSCNRGAHLAGPKYAGDANTKFIEDTPPESRVKMAYDKFSKPDTNTNETSALSLPLTDLDSVPFPPPDQPRETDPKQLPILFATARPNIGLTHEVRKSTIDKRLEAYFAKRPVRPIDGEHTCTFPQQRGTSFTSFKLALPEKEEVLLKGIDTGIYRGSVPEGFREKDIQEEAQKETYIDITHEEREALIPATVSLHVDNEPLQKPKPLSKASRRVSFPASQDKKSRS